MPKTTPTGLESTKLYQHLLSQQAAGDCRVGFAEGVHQLCEEAATRLKYFPALHQQFTLHDEVHCLRVVELMASIAGDVLNTLNALESALLILSAYFHDQGMIVDAEELPTIRASDDWSLHQHEWQLNHPNYAETQAILADPSHSTAEQERARLVLQDLDALMFTDFVRLRHGPRSATHVASTLASDPRLKHSSGSLAPLLSKLCLSHVLPATDINVSQGFHSDELFGTTRLDMQFLAFVLRLADILDFDRDRTPDVLYRSISFSSTVSLQEWEKHRSITGWEVSAHRLQYTATCSHPVYHRAILSFLDDIDIELTALHSWNARLPASQSARRIHLPSRVDRSRVIAEHDPVSGQPLYIFHDLEFSLSRNEIVKLLMTDELYSNTSLFLRELLQNALDAVRYREALSIAAAQTAPAAQIRFEHTQDAGVDIVRCIDNGAGMDEAAITRFLTHVGRSFYRTQQFEQDRSRFRAAGCDFDPCARFGIGFMSCFMFGDDITIYTRRDYGPGQAYGSPLVVEIRGLSGMIVMRPGPADMEIGTTVEIRGRRGSMVIDSWSDPVNLVDVLCGYGLAVEYPVSATCTVPAIARDYVISPSLECRSHPLEVALGEHARSFRIDLSTVDERLRGELRLVTMADSAGVPTIDLGELTAERITKDSAGNTELVLRDADGAERTVPWARECEQLCCDGILVAGSPGRTERPKRLGSYSCNLGLWGLAHLIDVRGDLKPTLTPARRPPREHMWHDPTWDRLRDVLARGTAQLLGQVLDACRESSQPERAWSVCETFGLDTVNMPLLNAWDSLALPFVSKTGVIEWVDLESIQRVAFCVIDEELSSVVVRNDEGHQLATPEHVGICRGKRSEHGYMLWQRLLLSLSQVDIRTDNEFELRLTKPCASSRLADCVRRDSASWKCYFKGLGALTPVVWVGAPLSFGNTAHPIVHVALETRYKRGTDLSPLERFASRLSKGLVGGRFGVDPESGSWDWRVRKELGTLHSMIDWTAVHENLHPPYRFFWPGHGEESLTVEHLRAWKDIDLPSEFE